VALVALIGIVGIPAGIAGYIMAAEAFLGRLPEKRQDILRPWMWLAPALVFLSAFLIYPALDTLYLSVRSARSTEFVGFENYLFAITNDEMRAALGNNLLWLVIFPTATVGVGLVVAVLIDRARYESLVRSILFMPMGVSFVAASVTWKFVYAYRPPGEPQIGALNALVSGVVGHAHPVAWLVTPPVNNAALITVGVWVWTGFCLVVLSAALKTIPGELPEAARVDGATEWQVFRAITLPAVRPTIGVVVTAMVIFALKAFDIVYVMTNGNFDTEVIANRMYKEMFVFRDFGRASAIAVLLFAATLPVIVANIRRFRDQEALR
jgi:alpha-glucoside transport system permease protein